MYLFRERGEVGRGAAGRIEFLDGDSKRGRLAQSDARPDHGVEHRGTEAGVHGDEQLTGELRPSIEHRPDHPDVERPPLILRDLVEDLQRLEGALEREGPRLDDQEGERAREERIRAEHAVRARRTVDQHMIELEPLSGSRGERLLEALLRMDHPAADLLEFGETRLRGQQRDATGHRDERVRDRALVQQDVGHRRTIGSAAEAERRVRLRIEVDEQHAVAACSQCARQMNGGRRLPTSALLIDEGVDGKGRRVRVVHRWPLSP